MNNNDRLIRLRYALNINDTEMLTIFQLGGVTVPKEQLNDWLTKQEKPIDSSAKICDNRLLEVFLNGLIRYKRGEQRDTAGKEIPPTFLLTDPQSVNNVLIKKVKIALALTSDEVIDTLRLAGVYLSDSELSAILRKEGHRKYKQCGDRYARNFLKGLTIKFRH